LTSWWRVSSDIPLNLFDDNEYVQCSLATIATFDDLVSRGGSSRMTKAVLAQWKFFVRASDVLNHQFTSGMKCFS
jgi:hypothetical protein